LEFFMKTSTVVGTIIILLIAAGTWYYIANVAMPTHAPQDAMQGPGPSGPSTAAGINGSSDQGNLGQPDNGAVQKPMADGAEGSIIGNNLALGLDGTAGRMHLIGYNGMTLYTKDGDSVTASTCYGKCETNWPSYIVGPEDNLTHLQAGVTGKVGTITRTDGKLQVVYNGKPLYFYVGDKSGSDTAGDGIGGVWHVAMQ
jgi:predicted lipoprotein with Yx(FWY)xxD motif